MTKLLAEVRASGTIAREARPASRAALRSSSTAVSHRAAKVATLLGAVLIFTVPTLLAQNAPPVTGTRVTPAATAQAEGSDVLPQLASELSLVGGSAAVPGAETLPGVLREVWTSNPQVTQALAELEATGFDIDGARTGYYPFLAVDAAIGGSDTSATALRIVQPLWNGGRTAAEIDEATAQRETAIAELGGVRLALGLQLAEAYLNVALADEQARQWQQYIVSLDGLLDVITRRSEQGVSSPVDVETAVTRIRQAEAGAQAAAALRANSLSTLRSLLNRQIKSVNWPTAATQLTASDSERILTGGVVSMHPERLGALSQIAGEEARLRIDKASLWPALSLQHQRRLEQESGDATPDSSTQLILSYQTGNSLRGYRSYQGAQRRVQAARQRLDAIDLDIANRIRAAQVDRDAAANQFRAQAASAQSAERLVDSFLRQFKVGRKSWVEVLNARREANDSLQQAVVTKRNYWLANLRLALEGMLWNRLSPDAPTVPAAPTGSR